MHSEAGVPELELTRLSPSEMGQGVLVANRNARRLLADGILLFEHSRYPSAAALAVLAMEEAVKWSLLLRVTILHDEKQLRAAWKDGRWHEWKLTRSLRGLMEAQKASGGTLPSVTDMELARSMNSMKLRCIYTAFVVGRRWVSPAQVCDRKECYEHLSVALTSTTSHLRLTGRRLGVYFKQVGALADQQEEDARQSLISWSEGEEAAALAAEDDKENDAFRADAMKRLRLNT